MAQEVHVLVGCGGSGIKALKRFNQLLSQDYYWRGRMDNDIYYVIADTDSDDMEDFDRSVNEDLAGSPDNVHVIGIQLSRGVSGLQEIVREHFTTPFKGAQDTTGQERLLEHWWNRGPDAPFFAPRVRSLHDGAGQCPPVSYFLTWRNLDVLERKFGGLVKEIMTRVGGFKLGTVLNFVIVAGLAGGTGRGSWQLIAFKLRELFSKYGNPPTPRAFLFDSSVFSDVMDAHETQRVPMRVNSLTGVSELSCWMANMERAQKSPRGVVRYQLPSMVNPAEEDADVLKVDLELDVNQAAPVNHAYLVFDDNGVAHLGPHSHYCEMVGAALYAAISKSAILNQEINSNFPYVGMAAATFEVNAATIRRYFEHDAPLYAIEKLLKEDGNLVEAKVSGFMKKRNLYVDVTKDEFTKGKEDGYKEYKCVATGTLLQRVLQKLKELSEAKVGAVEEALGTDDVNEVDEAVKTAMNSDDELVQQAFDEALEEFKIGDKAIDPVKDGVDAAKKLLERADSEGNAKSQSVANVKRFVDELRDALEVEIKEMPDDGPPVKPDPKGLVAEYSSRPFPVLARRFDQEEIDEIIEATRRGILNVNYVRIRKLLEEQYDRWTAGLNRISQNADDVTKCLSKLRRTFKNRRKQTAGDEGFAQLFTDPEDPEASLTERYSARKFYRRDLKPVMTDERREKLLEEHVELREGTFKVIKNALDRARDFEAEEQFEVRDSLWKALEQAISTEVGVPERFVVENFSICKVIEELRGVWQNRLRKTLGWDRRVHVEERFKEFFGFVPDRTDESGTMEYQFPDVDDFVLRMAASLAKTCRPYWKLKRAPGEESNVTLFVPTTSTQEDAKNAVEKYINDDTLDVQVFVEEQTSSPTGTTTANPFLMLAYSNEGADSLEKVESLNYYVERGVYDLVRDAEDPSGDTIFEGARNGGMGYVDPLYVRDEGVRDMRWHPWLKEDEANSTAERQTCDALLYALFPGDEDASEGLQDIKAKLRTFGWKMPLFREKKGNRYYFTRQALKLVDDTPETDYRASSQAWNADKPVSAHAGLNHVFQVLEGTEDAQEKGTWRARIIGEAELFWSDVLTQTNLAPKTPAYRQMLKDYVAWIANELQATADDHPGKGIWVKLLERLEEMTQA